jgi:cytochrome c
MTLACTRRSARIRIEHRNRHTPTRPSKQKDLSMTNRLLIVSIILATSIGSASAQDLAAGATSFKKCASCHELGDNAKNKVGPLLNGLEGRRTGTIAGYNYSDANKNSGIVWNDEQFLDYIKDPKKKIPGTKMVFAGIKNENEAKSLWAYLKQFGADGKKK